MSLVRAYLARLDLRPSIAVAVGLAVALLSLRGIVPAGAGVYYDDGVYLALAESLAEGDGYAYANLPGDVPGVKYPPAYPALLAAVSILLPAYPANLVALKAMNAALLGLAATLAFLAFSGAHGGLRRRTGTVGPDVVIPDRDAPGPVGRWIALGVLGLATLLGYGSAQGMVLSTALLSEPLFLAFSMAALGLAGRRTAHPAVVGFLAAGAFLTRGIGVAVVGAVLAGELLRRGGIRRRGERLGWAAAGSVPWMAAWLLWSGSRAGDVPEPLAGQYGTYAAWWADGTGRLLDRLTEIAAAHWTPFLTNLEMIWIPDASRTTANFVLAVLGVVVLIGAVRVGRRNPALALFPIFYLIVVLAWPYEPDRFFYAIIPTLTVLLGVGGLAVSERIREDMPNWGGPAVAVVAALLLLNSVAWEVEAHAKRVWTVFQAAPAGVYGPLNAWIRENTGAEDVVASGLDPLVYWETGRKAVPNFEFLAEDYGRYDGSAETLVREFERILEATGARWVAVVEGEGKAGATMAAFVETHPERARRAFDSEAGGFTGVVYEVLPPGETFEAPPTSE